MKSSPAISSLRNRGVTLVEIMVALAIGSFLLIGALQVYSQSREAYVVNESIARVQETAQFAMDTLEADVRMASNFGLQSRGFAISGRSLETNGNPKNLPLPTTCGEAWSIDLDRPIEGTNNGYMLPCPASGGVQPQSDSLTVRRTTVEKSAVEAGRLQIQSTRIAGELFSDGILPAGFDPVLSETHDLLVNTYYVAADSSLIPGTPALRRKMLTSINGTPAIVDQEIAPGVENLQFQFGVDIDGDNTVDRYVNPGDPVIDPAAISYIADARIITARIWLIIRSVSPEIGIQDNRSYAPGDVSLGMFADQYRRMQVSKTVLLRNART